MKTTAVSANNRWTEADLDKLASLKVMNTSVADIAKTLGRTVKAVQTQLYAAAANKTKTGQRLQHLIGVKSQAAQRKATPKIKDATTPGSKPRKRKAAPKIKDATTTPGFKPLKHNARWTNKDNTKLVTMFATGSDPDTMAKELNRTVHSILDQLHKNGILSFDKINDTYYTKPVAYYKVVSPAPQVAK